VNETASREQQVTNGQPGVPGQGDVPPGLRGGRRRRGGWVALGLVVVLAGGAVWAWRAGVFSPAATTGAGQQGAPPPATAVVTRQDLSAATPVTATLGYAGSYTVSVPGGGTATGSSGAATGTGGATLTWLPSPGQVIGQGQVLYKTDNGSPVVMLYGSVPAWRDLGEGDIGQDVAQLNHDLVHLGYADRGDITAQGWDYYSWETTYAVQLLEEHQGVAWPSGSLSLGQVVFEPEALRVTQVTGSLGGAASGPVLDATSDRHVVLIALDVSYESQVQVGDKVSVTLPDGSQTSGVVSSVGTVASSSTSTSGSAPTGQSSTTTIPVTVALSDPRAAGSLDQAPVTVYITTGSAQDVLTVPVSALVAQASGVYEVEVVGSRNTERWVPVTAGPVFDDNNGRVQVTGALTPGERVAVPAP
jgi:hypothetical protein